MNLTIEDFEKLARYRTLEKDGVLIKLEQSIAGFVVGEIDAACEKVEFRGRQ
jgi:hypothetical protein